MICFFGFARAIHGVERRHVEGPAGWEVNFRHSRPNVRARGLAIVAQVVLEDALHHHRPSRVAPECRVAAERFC